MPDCAAVAIEIAGREPTAGKMHPSRCIRMSELKPVYRMAEPPEPLGIPNAMQNASPYDNSSAGSVSALCERLVQLGDAVQALEDAVHIARVAQILQTRAEVLLQTQQDRRNVRAAARRSRREFSTTHNCVEAAAAHHRSGRLNVLRHVLEEGDGLLRGHDHLRSPEHHELRTLRHSSTKAHIGSKSSQYDIQCRSGACRRLAGHPRISLATHLLDATRVHISIILSLYPQNQWTLEHRFCAH